jgi:hypothetical protein
MFRVFGTIAATLLFFTGAAQAVTVVNGSVWFVDGALASSGTFATPGNVPGTPANVTFSLNTPIGISIGDSSSQTLGDFLASGGAFAITENIAGSLAQIANNTLFNFTGTVSVTTGQVFSVAHDDGLTLTIGSQLVIDAPGPTSPDTTFGTYTGPSGNFAFQLVYGECCGGPAVLEIDLPFAAVTSVPEPSTWAMMILGFGGVGFMAYRRKRHAPALRMV